MKGRTTGYQKSEQVLRIRRRKEKSGHKSKNEIGYTRGHTREHKEKQSRQRELETSPQAPCPPLPPKTSDRKSNELVGKNRTLPPQPHRPLTYFIQPQAARRRNDTMRMLSTTLPVVIALAACQHSYTPSPLENFIAKVDAEAAVQQLQYEQQQQSKRSGKSRMAKVAPNACVRENDAYNTLYSPSGTIIYQGGPASINELVWVGPNGQVEQVSTITGNQGSYIAFTPQTIYVSQPGTGSSARLSRSTSAQATVPATKTSTSTPAQSATSPSGAASIGTPPANTLQQLPAETPTSPSTEV